MKDVLKKFHEKYPTESLFMSTTHEFVESIESYLDEETLSMMLHSERIIMFRVPWIGDDGKLNVNYGYRVQHSSALGPYKGGLRFHPTVSLDVVKFLAFEQTLKNALTGLPLGGAKGGSDFDPKGKSDREIMLFCQSFMNELYRHIGARIDVPAGDLGVGGREIGYLYGQFKKLTGSNEGVLTGKDLVFGGAAGRSEATGYGLIYITEGLLADLNETFVGKRVVISGSGKVGAYTAKKAVELGAIVVAMNDSDCTLVDMNGLDPEDIIEYKLNRRVSLRQLAHDKNLDVYESSHIWSVPCDYAFPCATQNELNDKQCQTLIENGCRIIAEGANRPLTTEAVALVRASDVYYLPGKAANAGGVAVSGIEMIQNAQLDVFEFDYVDGRLKKIMQNIYTSIRDKAIEINQPYDFVAGANLVGYERIRKAIKLQGAV